ncbi:hypothetical protein C8Q80DRAFT_1184087 [Daedaleopsis nitida]|nr:hypothetical protein C8Q80DRAFT_1184087 [Daedaleopsis nitida]
MRNLKQTTLSFATLPKKGAASTGPRQPSTAPSAASSYKSYRSGTFMDYVEIPQPAKRIPRTQPATDASSTKAKPSSPKRTVYAEPRKPSLKRKLLSTPESNTQPSGGRVQVPRITVDPASSPGVQSEKADIRMRSPSSSKKRRLSVLSSTYSELTSLPTSHHGSSVHDNDTDDIECVPTSQSDEQELVIPRSAVKDATEVQENVSRWKKTLPGLSSRRGSVSDSIRSGSPLTDVPMDEDYGPFDTINTGTTAGEEPRDGFGISYPQTPSSPLNFGLRELANSSPLSAPIAARNTQHRSQNSKDSPSEAFCSLTPPPSDEDHKPMVEDVPVVEALDEKSKTARLIADIKARARAAAHSSPEQSPIDLDDFSDLSSSSSDDDDGLVSKLTRGKEKATGANTPGQAGSSKPLNGASLRYNLRRSSPPRLKEKMVTPITQGRKPRKADPLGALLREKEREERTGTGMAAVRLADETLAKAKESLRDEMMDEEDYESDAAIDVATNAWGTRGKSKTLIAGPSRVRGRKRGAETEDEDAVVKTFNFEGLLGKDGQDVKRILARDIKEKMAEAIARRNEVPLGVPFWSSRDGGVGERHEGMDMEPTLPPFTADVGGNTIRQLLKDATARNDVTQVSALLSTGFVTSLSPEQYPVIIPWLFNLAFSNINSTAITLAYKQLARLGPVVASQPSGLRLSTVLNALVRLGVSPNVLIDHGWADCAGDVSISSKANDVACRAEMTYRLVSLVSTFAQSLVRDELSDIVLLLTLIAMDSTTSDSVQTEVRKAIDRLSLAMVPAHEFAACAKIIAFGRALTAPNQSLLVSMIPSTSLATIRMSRYVARSFLLDAEPTALQYSDELPPLAPLVDLLSPASGSGGYFDIVGNADKEGFYDDLTFRISLLGNALSDIDEYTIIEKQATQEAAMKQIWDAMDKKLDAAAGLDKVEEEEKEKEKEGSSTSLVERVKNALDKLHGKIVDTRAAHLERSRAKAALQRLAYRIHYQRVAALKSGVNATRPRNLLGYFQGAATS